MEAVEKKLRIKPSKGSWKRFYRLLASSKIPWLLVFLTIALSLSGSRIGAIFPDFQRRITGGDLSTQTLLTALGIMSVSIILTAVNDWLNGYTRHLITKRLIDKIWAKILALPLSTYQKIEPKELISRTTTDTSSLSAIFITLISNVLTNSYALYLSLGYVFSYHSTLGYVLLAMIPLMLIEKLIQGRISFRFAYSQQMRLAKLTEYLSQILINIPLVKVFVKEKHEKKRGRQAIEEYNKARFKVEVLDIVFTGFDSALMTLNNILAVVIGGALVAKGEIDTGTWIAFYMYSSAVNSSVLLIAQMWPMLKQAQGAVDRITEVMENESEPYSGQPIAQNEGDLCFENVSFSYGEKAVLKNLNFCIKEGSFVAVVGASGAGKTSLLALIERFFKPQSGQITIGGQDIQDFDLQEWRSSFGYVTQEINLFSGTLRDAFTYGMDPIPDDKEILLAAKAAQLDEFIAAQADGLDTPVAEGGMTFSGGERQRFIIARVLLQQPKRLLLDEATSNLDSEAEYEVMSVLSELANNRTTICVAHRLSTVRNADQIIVLDQGEIKAVGKHAELMENCSLYRELVNVELLPETEDRNLQQISNMQEVE
ncbi:MAG: ABC transporter ATP-binding protein [Eubacteriales bacterium]|nr:ABC transporter ATP-binding protein [Eubacteriales bacterium]